MKPATQSVSVVATLFLIAALAGCSNELRNDAASPHAAQVLAPGAADLALRPTAEAGGPVDRQSAGQPPAGIVHVSVGEQAVSFWPYTGEAFDGQPKDPVNLVFVGRVDPVQIRSALLALDGDRTAYGFPPAYPFNARWSDAMGDVQTTYADGAGWIGSVIQLQLGEYQPVRVHLRLFRAGNGWTLGAAHFELMIPGTADHQVLSWELAEKVVMADMVRSGLLDPTTPITSTGPLNAAPGFREIPDFLYNQLPPELIAAIGGPATPVTGGVPIGTDGEATVLHVTGSAVPDQGTHTQNFTISYGQVVPKPFCSDGPGDWMLVSGPVEFEASAAADGAAGYKYGARITGRLTATPVDITVNPPRPLGDPIPVLVTDRQDGSLDALRESVTAHAVRLLTGSGGSEFRRTDLVLPLRGHGQFVASTHCSQP